MTAAILARAESAVDKGVRYSLGCGGWEPTDALPCRKTWRRPKGKLLPVRALWCDCSGFISWVIGLSRKTTIVKGLWGISTVSIYRDAMGSGRYFRLIQASEAQPGDFCVYPDKRDPVTKKTVQGHVAVIADVARRQVVDCGSSSGGITKRVAGFWGKCVFVRFVGSLPT